MKKNKRIRATRRSAFKNLLTSRIPIEGAADDPDFGSIDMGESWLCARLPCALAGECPLIGGIRKRSQTHKPVFLTSRLGLLP